jgi:AcrR family transcriptional regulator
MTDTRTRLMDGTLQVLREKGIAGASARTIAAAAEVNQALIFYHFGSLDGLLIAACEHGAAQRVAAYAKQLDEASTLAELLEVGTRLHAQEQQEGNVLVLAQMLAGAQSDPKLATATAKALGLWIEQIEAVLNRVLAGSPLAEFLDLPGLARAISAAFVGFELYDGVDRAGADQAMAAVAQLGYLVEVIDDLGPASRRLLRSKLRRAAGS